MHQVLLSAKILLLHIHSVFQLDSINSDTCFKLNCDDKFFLQTFQFLMERGTALTTGGI